ncbi:MAG: type II toxin-antitoxin system VapC family toxin [Tolypothrix brevis GSE-NOS-MK-07-07A]|jgi:predicted nucleic acid-binding protein|nr:type II toxin-antitoxin system VapC family toxin [Tolypothrix brevis GSE-NOS-MK-07-07A]
MTDFWVDANVLLRFLTGEPPELAERALRLIQRAEQGEINLKLSPIVVAEIVWVLSSFYRYSRTQIAEVLLPLIASDGISCDEIQQVTAALSLMASANVDFLDAYLAEIARYTGESVVSFDRDFRRLGINWVEPE